MASQECLVIGDTYIPLVLIQDKSSMHLSFNCSISILLTSSAVWGAHTVEAYAIIGSTDVLKQCSLIWREQALRFRCKNARSVIDFDNTCLTRSFQVSLESITTPKYLTEFTSLIGTSLMWYMWTWEGTFCLWL